MFCKFYNDYTHVIAVIDSNPDNCYFIVLDCAYLCTRKCLVPLKGPQKYIQENDAYNFYLSQLRIKIE